MATIIDELVSILGYKVQGQENLRQFKQGLSDAEKRAEGLASGITNMARGVTTGMLAIGSAIAGVTGSMFALANAAAGPLDELGKAADRAGVSFEALQELGFAAEQSGSSVTELSNAVEMMSRRLAEAARGQGRAKTALEAYGLSATDASGEIKSATDFLGELADTFQGLSAAERLDLGQQLGLSRGLITMLSQGNDELERMRQVARDAGLIFTDEDRSRAEAYNDAMNTLMRTVRAMRDRIAIDLLPTLMQMIGGMQDWLNANRAVIQQNVGGFLERIGRHAQTVSTGFRRLQESAIPLEAVLAGLLAVLRPKWLIFLAVAAVVDEFLTYLDGGDTIIGRFVSAIQDMTGASKETAEAIAGITAALAALLAWGGWRALKAKMAATFGGAAAGGAAAGGAAKGGLLGAIGGFLARNAGNLGRAGVQGGALVLGQMGITKGLDALDRALNIDTSKREEIDTSTGAIIGRIADSIRSSAPKPMPRSDQAAAPEEIPQYGRQTAVESISVPLSSMNGERFSPSIGGTITDNRDQSTNVDVGGINVTVPPGADGARMGQEAADALRRALSIHGASPATP